MIEEHFIEAKAAVKLYAEAETDLLKLKLAKKTTRYAGKIVAYAVTLLIAIVAVMILLMALGFALADVFQNIGLGFLCAGGFGLLLTLLSSLLMRKMVEKPIIQKVLKELADV